MPEHEDSGQVDLGFLYKMLDTRDSSKRRVKPADPAFLYLPKPAQEENDSDYEPEADPDNPEKTEPKTKPKNTSDDPEKPKAVKSTKAKKRGTPTKTDNSKTRRSSGDQTPKKKAKSTVAKKTAPSPDSSRMTTRSRKS